MILDSHYDIYERRTYLGKKLTGKTRAHTCLGRQDVLSLNDVSNGERVKTSSSHVQLLLPGVAVVVAAGLRLHFC